MTERRQEAEDIMTLSFGYKIQQQFEKCKPYVNVVTYIYIYTYIYVYIHTHIYMHMYTYI